MKKVILYSAAIALAVTGFFSSTPRAVQSAGNGVFESDSHSRFQDQTNELRIAVTPKGYDDIGSILKSMGWTYTEIKETQLTDNEFLAQFDVIFINCAGSNYMYSDTASASLEQFVRGGGTLYASDLASDYIDKSFPGYIHFYDHPGDVGAQTIIADVVDPGLAQYLNSSTEELEFDWTAWVPIDSVTDAVKVYLSGDFTIRGDTPAGNTALAASFSYGEGRVVYVAYHLSDQTTQEQKKLLDYLVFVTTSEELSARLQESLAGLGYGMQEELLGSLSVGDTSPQYTFSNQSITELAVGLNWQEGTLRLSVFKPDGSLYKQQEGSPPLIIEIPNAEAGDWSYQVDAIDVPHDNYPYVVQINVPAVVAATPSATPQIGVPAIVEATPSASPENPADNDIAPGNQGTMIFIVVGGVLCLALLFAVVLIGIVVMVIKRRRA